MSISDLPWTERSRTLACQSATELADGDTKARLKLEKKVVLCFYRSFLVQTERRGHLLSKPSLVFWLVMQLNTYNTKKYMSSNIVIKSKYMYLLCRGKQIVNVRKNLNRIDNDIIR